MWFALPLYVRTAFIVLLLLLLTFSAARPASAQEILPADTRQEDTINTLLSLRGWAYGPVDLDARLTPRTRATIREFQRAYMLPITGVLDPPTQTILGIQIREQSIFMTTQKLR